MHTYTAVVERCRETGLYVGDVPGFPGAHSQGETLDELNANLREVIALILAGGDSQRRHIDRAFAATVHAFQGKTADRILAAMPSGNPNLTNQQAFYVAISRARDRAELVTDDAHKLADQLERATGERLAALDATAKQAAHEAVFGRERAHERERDHVTRADDTMDRYIESDRRTHREHEHEREHRIEYELGQGRGRKLRERSAGRERMDRDSGAKDRELGEDPGRTSGPGRDSVHEKIAEPKQKTPDFDLGM